MSLDSWERNAIQRHSRLWASLWNICDIGYYLFMIGGFMMAVWPPINWLMTSIKKKELTQYHWQIQVALVVVFVALWYLCANGKGWISQMAYRKGWIKESDYNDMSLFK